MHANALTVAQILYYVKMLLVYAMSQSPNFKSANTREEPLTLRSTPSLTKQAISPHAPNNDFNVARVNALSPVSNAIPDDIPDTTIFYLTVTPTESPPNRKHIEAHIPASMKKSDNSVYNINKQH